MQQKRSLTISGVRTSIALESEFWRALTAIAAGRKYNLTELVTQIDNGRDNGESLASTLRVFALLNYNA